MWNGTIINTPPKWCFWRLHSCPLESSLIMSSQEYLIVICTQDKGILSETLEDLHDFLTQWTCLPWVVILTNLFRFLRCPGAPLHQHWNIYSFISEYKETFFLNNWLQRFHLLYQIPTMTKTFNTSIRNTNEMNNTTFIRKLNRINWPGWVMLLTLRYRGTEITVFNRIAQSLDTITAALKHIELPHLNSEKTSCMFLPYFWHLPSSRKTQQNMLHVKYPVNNVTQI